MTNEEWTDPKHFMDNADIPDNVVERALTAFNLSDGRDDADAMLEAGRVFVEWALEEAASYCETDGLVRTAAAIRALKDK